MNSTKRKMIIVSIVLSFLSALASVASLIIVLFSKEQLANIDPDYSLLFNSEIFTWGFVFLTILGVALIACGNALLLVSINKNGAKFKERRSLFITGIVLIAITGPTSLYAILLYVALSLKDWDKMCPPTEDYIFNQENGTTEEISPNVIALQIKIDELKKLREEGSISEEEYQKMLSDLL